MIVGENAAFSIYNHGISAAGELVGETHPRLPTISEYPAFAKLGRLC